MKKFVSPTKSSGLKQVSAKRKAARCSYHEHLWQVCFLLMRPTGSKYVFQMRWRRPPFFASSSALMASLSERAFTSALSMRAVVKEESPLAGMVMKWK